MNFLADESCAGPVVRTLREAGRDVVAIAEVARGATDEQVLERALGHVPHLRCSASYIPCSQRLRAGLKYAAPTALEEATRKDTEKAATRLPHSERAQQCLPAAGGLRYVWRGGRARHSGCCPECSMPCPCERRNAGRDKEPG